MFFSRKSGVSVPHEVAMLIGRMICFSCRQAYKRHAKSNFFGNQLAIFACDRHGYIFDCYSKILPKCFLYSLFGNCSVHCFGHLMLNCWFGARWFGIRIGIPVSNNPIPFIFGDPIGIQPPTQVNRLSQVATAFLVFSFKTKKKTANQQICTSAREIWCTGWWIQIFFIFTPI